MVLSNPFLKLFDRLAGLVCFAVCYSNLSKLQDLRFGGCDGGAE